jgi:hypothetical protein
VGSRALAASSACTSCSSTRFTLTRPEGGCWEAHRNSGVEGVGSQQRLHQLLLHPLHLDAAGGARGVCEAQFAHGHAVLERQHARLLGERVLVHRQHPHLGAARSLTRADGKRLYWGAA